MRNTKKIRLLSLIAALALAVTALPLSAALADDAGHIVLFTDVTDDTEKSYLQTVTAYAGDSVTIYVPVLNKNLDSATNLTCALPVVDDAAKFPFVKNSETEIARDVPRHQKWDATDEKLISWDGNLAVSERAYFKMTATLLSTLTPGDYYLPFVVSYSDGSSGLTDTVTVHIYIREKIASSGGSGGSSYRSKPKVILESYSFAEETIYAGDTVTLRLVIANTSAREAVTNLQLDFSNDAGVILPAPGGSSSVFIGTIDKDDAYMLTVRLQVASDAEAKSQLLNLKLSYEGTKNRQEFEETASVSVPVQQKARVRINTPVIYDDPWVNGNVSVGVTLYNLGKSTLYNCMVDVVGDNITLEEPYFGGNVASGGTMRADLSVVPSVGGQLDAQVRVTYEDVNGTPTEELLPLSMFVNDDTSMPFASPGDAMGLPDDKPAAANIGWIFWLFGGAAALTGLVFLGVKLKKKRARELEDL
jgi:hypothetical protein